MNDAATTPREQRIDPQVAGARVARMYARHGRTLYGLCRMLLRDADEAEDALQSTFLSAHRALARGGAPRDEAAWLVTIARNECRGRIRARMDTPVAGDVDELEALADPAPTPDERLADPAVQQALEALPERQREAVVLHDAFGLRSREVGTALGISTPAVEALLFRARRQLRLRLSPAGALVLPATVGAALAQAIPGFVVPASAGIAGATGGVAGAGIIAKLAGAPTAAKVAAGVAVAATAGSVAVVDATRAPETPRPALVAAADDPDGSPPARTADASGQGSSTTLTSKAGRPVPQTAGRSDGAVAGSRSPGRREEGAAAAGQRPIAAARGDERDVADDGGERRGDPRDAPAAATDDEADDGHANSEDGRARSGKAIRTKTEDDDVEDDGTRTSSIDDDRDGADDVDVDVDVSDDGTASGSGSEDPDHERDEPDVDELDTDGPEEPESDD